MNNKAAFVVDALMEMGGAERVLLQALKLFPKAPIYTLVYNPDPFDGTSIGEHPVIPSLIDRLPLAHAAHRRYLPLMPLAVQQFDLRPYDLILSFSYAVAHGVRIHPGQRLLSYTYTPMRYAWRGFKVGRAPAAQQWLVDCLLDRFRRWDRAVSSRVTRFAAVSSNIAAWVRRIYQREARVIYPPVELDRFSPQSPRDNFYITVTRLVPHKRVDLIVRAFSRLQLPLTVVGEGPELKALQRIAAPNILFTGYIPDAVVAHLLGRARAFVCAAQEDFGISMIEAQASGCPVIAYGAGGALETVLDQQTGLFFPEQTEECLTAAVEQFQAFRSSFSERDLLASARRFSEQRFLDEYADFVNQGLS